jgi:type I restriction enzyme M protein
MPYVAAASEDPDEFWSRTCFGCRRRRAGRKANAKQPSIGKLIDEAMAAIEVANLGLKGVLPKDYNRPALDR